MILFRHQKIVFEEIKKTAHVFFQSDWKNLPIKPRFNRFIAGPTGTGKSHLIRILGEKLNVPSLEICAGDWIPLGCTNRGAKVTWKGVSEFCSMNERGIIFIDELDKLDHSTAWMQHVRVEIFNVLDRRVSDMLDIDDEAEIEKIKERLSCSIFIIAAGAFQNLIEEKTTVSIGFDEQIEDKLTFETRELSRIIPRELINRFASPILVLPELHRSDYVDILKQVVAKLPKNLARKVQKIGEKNIQSAIDNGTGCRWAEELLLQALMEGGKGKEPIK